MTSSLDSTPSAGEPKQYSPTRTIETPPMSSLYTDRYALPLSTASAHAAERYRAGVDLLLSLWPGAAEALDEAIAADPDFAMALSLIHI